MARQYRDFHVDLSSAGRIPLSETHGNAQPTNNSLSSLDSCSASDPFVVLSQRLYSDTKHSNRYPLKEADSNAQSAAHNLAGLKDVYPSSYGGMASLPPSIPRPLIVPTQSFEGYGGMGDLRLRRQFQENREHQSPFYLVPAFDAYRKKQADKDEKTKVWPDLFEHAFLDALLLIPLNFGRKKYSMRGRLFGRNMLISEYIWLVYLLSLPEGATPDEELQKARKKVSSHLQVIKDFLKTLCNYHFIFPQKEQAGRRRESVLDTESMKDNPVLCALAEQRLPDVRPNYAYFAELLTADRLIIVRPSTCWILISSTTVTVQQDGQGIKSDGQRLDPNKYPHLPLNLARENWPKHGSVIRGALLHEYTRSMSQFESTSVQDLTQDWEEDFPELMPAVDRLLEEDCKDVLHFNVTLEVQEPDEIPKATHLTSLVEVSLERPALQTHSWKSVTKLVRPWQLTEGDDVHDTPSLVEVTKDMGIPFAHRGGCDGSKPTCECLRNARQRKSELVVPFPADEWAVMLSHLSQHRKHPQGSPRDDLPRDVDEEREVTQWDLLKQVAMFQELWSCAGEGQPWTRRAVIFWTFDSVWHYGREKKDDPEKWLKGAAGTKWRHISTVDPDGEYHQQMALIYNTPSGNNAATPARSHNRVQPPTGPYSHESIVPPSPHLHHQDPLSDLNYSTKLDQQLNAMLGDVYRPAPPTPHGYDLDALVAEHHGGGLPTPPPTASLHGAYPPFETHPQPHHSLRTRTPTSHPLSMPYTSAPHAQTSSSALDFLVASAPQSTGSSVCCTPVPDTAALAADPFGTGVDAHSHPHAHPGQHQHSHHPDLDAAFDDPNGLQHWSAQSALDVSPATAAAWSAEYGLDPTGSNTQSQWTVVPGEEWHGGSSNPSVSASPNGGAGGQELGEGSALWAADAALGALYHPEHAHGVPDLGALGMAVGEESPSARRMVMRGVKREREEDVEAYGLGSIQKLEGHLSVSDAKLGVEDW